MPRGLREDPVFAEAERRGWRKGIVFAQAATPDAVLLLDARGNIAEANQRAARYLGQRRGELKGLHFSRVVRPDLNPTIEHDRILEELNREAKPGMPSPHEGTYIVRLTNPRGQPVENYMRFVSYRTPGGEPQHIVHLTKTHDVVRKSQLFQQLLDINAAINNREHLSTVLDQLAHHVAKNFRAVCLVATTNGSHELELRAGAGKGFSISDFAPFTRIKFNEGLLGAAAAHETYKVVENIQAYSSTLAPELDRKYNFGHSIAIPLFANGAREGEKPILVGVMGVYKGGEYAGEKFREHEIELLRHIAVNAATRIYSVKLSDRLRHLAEHDDLTGLHNRGHLFRALNEYLRPHKDKNKVPTHALKPGTTFGLLYADADNLKPLNDVFGHDEGNNGLKSIAHALREAAKAAGVEQKAVVARIGGDEFAAFLPDADEEKTREVAEHFRRNLREIVQANPKFSEAGFGASFAHTTFTTQGKTRGDAYNLEDLKDLFKEWKHVDEEHYLDGILKVPEDKAMALKTKAKRETGYVKKEFLRELADRLHQNPNIREEELLELLGRHTNLDTYHRRKRQLGG